MLAVLARALGNARGNDGGSDSGGGGANVRTGWEGGGSGVTIAVAGEVCQERVGSGWTDGIRGICATPNSEGDGGCGVRGGIKGYESAAAVTVLSTRD